MSPRGSTWVTWQPGATILSRFAMRPPVTPLPTRATRLTISDPAAREAANRHVAVAYRRCRAPEGTQQTCQLTKSPKLHRVAASSTEHVRRTPRMQPRAHAAPAAVAENHNETHRLLGGLVTGVGLPGIEPGTSSLSAMRSNRLSYSPSRYETLSADSQINTRGCSTRTIQDKALLSVRCGENRRRLLRE
jgi:hypothetical protein